jgi:hypothetical protein
MPLLLCAPAYGQDVAGTAAEGSGNQVTRTRTNGRMAFAILTDEATQTHGFLSLSRDDVTGAASMDFAWATPSASEPDIVILIQGAGEIPGHAVTVERTAARLNVVTPFPTVRCTVSLQTGEFDCASAPSLAFDLHWTRTGFASEWQQTVSRTTIGPLTIHAQGQYESHDAAASGIWANFVGRGMMGTLGDSKGSTVLREVVLRMRR